MYVQRMMTVRVPLTSVEYRKNSSNQLLLISLLRKVSPWLTQATVLKDNRDYSPRCSS